MKELRNALLVFENAKTSYIELKLSRRKHASSLRTYTCSLKTPAHLIKAFFKATESKYSLKTFLRTLH